MNNRERAKDEVFFFRRWLVKRRKVQQQAMITVAAYTPDVPGAPNVTGAKTKAKRTSRQEVARSSRDEIIALLRKGPLTMDELYNALNFDGSEASLLSRLHYMRSKRLIDRSPMGKPKLRIWFTVLDTKDKESHE